MTLVELSRPSRPSIRRSSWLVRALVAITFLTAASSAWARPEFPGVIQETLEGCPPPCTICHTSASPNGNNVGQPFYNNLFELAKPGGITEANLPSLLALEASSNCVNEMDAGCIADGGCMRPCDANNNGKSDIEDLEAEIDPNPGAEITRLSEVRLRCSHCARTRPAASDRRPRVARRARRRVHARPPLATELSTSAPGLRDETPVGMTGADSRRRALLGETSYKCERSRRRCRSSSRHRRCNRHRPRSFAPRRQPCSKS